MVPPRQRAVQGELGGLGGLEDAVDGAGENLGDGFLEAQFLVLLGDFAPVEQVDVVAVVDEVLNHAGTGHQVEKRMGG